MRVVEENNLNIDSQGLTELVDAVFANEDGAAPIEISRKQVREGLEAIPIVKVLSETMDTPVVQPSLGALILKHCEDVEKGTLSKADIETALLKAC